MRNKMKQLAWLVFFLICAFYSGYAFYMGGVEGLSLLGVVQEAPRRAVPLVFVVHAFTGGAALLIGPLQFNGRLLSKKRRFHHLLGRIYVGATLTTSVAAFWSTLFFDVPPAAKYVMGVLAVLWFGSTAIAFRYIHRRRVTAHREWMIRSFSLSFFFVTFSFWVPGLAGTSLPEAVSYPLAVFLSWALNLLAAELWIRYSHPRWVANVVRQTA
ncbi:MAG: DUF2306 domain-containing protein [Anaerolineales bacterium]|nr:DUF2306 domain-containing protein [Anaerolineales bacterium]MCB8954557.1 DUF2306 domain-containing protein [Ardenticatenales bacterium]